MIAAWMIYSVGVGALLCVAALAAEFLIRAFGGPARAAWFGAMIGTIVLSASALLRHSPVAAEASVSAPASISLTAPASVVRYLDRGIQAAQPIVDGRRFTDWNTVLGTIAAFASIVAALYLIAAFCRLMLLERRLDRERIEDCDVLVSRDFGPALFGLRRMRIILPRWVLSLPELDRRLILDHERSHAAAGDPILLFIGMLLLIAQPWIVALWVIFLRLRLAIEMDCDRRVLGAGGDVARYGQLLISVYQRSTSALAPQVAFVERPTNLERRIRRMTSALPSPTSWRSIAAAVAAVTVVLIACRAPIPAAKDSLLYAQMEAELAKNPYKQVSITGGGICVSSDTVLTDRYRALYNTVAARHPHAGSDSLVGVLVDENCSLLQEKAIATVPHGYPDSVLALMFPGEQVRRAGSGVARFNGNGPDLLFAVTPSKSFMARRAVDECGFGVRKDDRCNLQGPIVMRRVDARRLIIAVRGAPIDDKSAPRDHMFLVSSLSDLPESLTQSIKFGHVVFKGNAVFVEDRASTATPFLFGGSFAPALDRMPRPMTRFDDLIGIAHYRAPVVTVDEVKNVRPAPTCDGPAGACWQVNGRVFEFPG
jgi:beta-lactamase regulating signal transducer with metallopeptidase domain